MASVAGELTGNGFTVLDGAALVAGAAVASVHLRVVVKTDPIGPGWAVVWGTFLWVAITSAGPFLYLVRSYIRPTGERPGVGDRLWALLGVPWIMATAWQRGLGGVDAPYNEALAYGLGLGLGVACLITICVIWVTWVAAPPDRASATFSGSWSNRVGLVLAIAWPLQCGVGMVVIG